MDYHEYSRNLTMSIRYSENLAELVDSQELREACEALLEAQRMHARAFDATSAAGLKAYTALTKIEHLKDIPGVEDLLGELVRIL
jgi:DNA-binding MurR/RpiR family transcriptional regulator